MLETQQLAGIAALQWIIRLFVCLNKLWVAGLVNLFMCMWDRFVRIVPHVLPSRRQLFLHCSVGGGYHLLR